MREKIQEAIRILNTTVSYDNLEDAIEKQNDLMINAIDKLKEALEN